MTATAPSTSAASAYLLTLLSTTEDIDRLSALCDALLTPKEQAEIGNRLQIFAYLQQGMTQREISARLGVGLATVSRGAKVYQQQRIDELLPRISEQLHAHAQDA